MTKNLSADTVNGEHVAYPRFYGACQQHDFFKLHTHGELIYSTDI